MILPRQGSFRCTTPSLEPLGQAPIGSQSCLQQLYVATGGRPVGPRRARNDCLDFFLSVARLRLGLGPSKG